MVTKAPNDFVAGWADRIEEAQTLTHVAVAGQTYPRVAYGPDSPDVGANLRPRCRDCGVALGQLHVIPCFREACAVCGAQAFGCPCLTDSEILMAH